jgi:GMP synthase (glutamine-hydrolysing)
VCDIPHRVKSAVRSGRAPAIHEFRALLVSTGFCRNQAFAWGTNAVGFQFHPEACGARLEQWFIGHACEIATAKLSVAELRADTSRYAASLEVQARRSFTEWFSSIG